MTFTPETERMLRGLITSLTALLLTACATPGPIPEQDLPPPPPQLTTLPTRVPVTREGPLAPIPGVPEVVRPVLAPAPLAAASAPLAAPADVVTGPGFEVGSLPPPPTSAANLPAQPESGAGAAGKPIDVPGALPAEPAEVRKDLWQRVREGYAIPDLGGAHALLVAEHERWYANRPDYVDRMTTRGGRYLFHIVQEVEKRGMPTELALLPFIESAFNPQAMSTAKASGMWQFIPSTGRHYDLTQNVFRDDRRDVLASTRAALDYLGRLNAEFNDWQLSLAAYNWGEGNVRRAIARNRKAGKPTDYASLRMPAETRHYVPKLLAVRNIVRQPDAFGLTLPALENHPYFLSVPMRRDIDVALAASLAEMSVDEFKALNPSMNKPVILAAGTPQILLPYDNAEGFKRRLDDHVGPLASWTAWVVPATMKPADAARRIGVSEATLREVNRIPPRVLVKAGSTLLVPRHAQREADVPEHLADHAHMALAPDRPLRKVSIQVRKGDTVASLAQRHRVSAAQLAQWNRMTEKARLSAGQKLVIWQAAPVSKKRSQAAPATRKKAAARPSRTAQVGRTRP
ncbi:transglycosylase SLT domain-containing protein [Sphaerotilus mobilis]|uniref:Membrane-bound lytic murein transglycosylase D n=1 Tax=Sphaerotilus mobilis TaxID=47994 RepID=A0A4Q7LPK4_9BURK|nr:transglycosylase SLT domain-containing protein [Sphaerotilus mobilis]RZS56646.1 membrane-bound lytic murein transglycosylase D [Sphaerotilus mobilis]